MAFGWTNLVNNQMVDFTDAQGGGYPLNSGQTQVTSIKCMTKDETITKYNVNATSFASYAANQLVPKGTFNSGTVYQSVVYGESATKNNCVAGSTGTSVDLKAYLGQFTSTVSQVDANNQAVTWVQTNKQSNANSIGNCTTDPTFGNEVQSQNFNKNNCTSGEYGTQVLYTVNANTHYAASLSAANTLALNDITANGQAFANTNGQCILNPVACNANNTYTGGQTMPSEFNIVVGTGLGWVPFDHDSIDVPDRFMVFQDGILKIDTGYVGDPAYQADLDIALGYHSPITSPGNGTKGFNKTSTSSVVVVKVFAPLSGTAWSFKVYCPDGGGQILL